MMYHYKYLLFFIALLSVQTSFAQLFNGGFENFGLENFLVTERQGASVNNSTCVTEGGTLVEMGTVQNAPDRPNSFRTTDDFLTTDLNNPAPAHYVTKTMDAHSGNSAVFLRADNFGEVDAPTNFGVVGLFNVESSMREALPVDYPAGLNYVPRSIKGFYKHTNGTSNTILESHCTGDGLKSTTTTYTSGFAVYAEMTLDDGQVVARINQVFRNNEDVTEFTAFSAPVEILIPNTLPDKIIFMMSTCPEFLGANPIIIPGATTTIDDVVFSSEPVALAVDWVEMTAERTENNQTEIRWMTANESNHSHFTVEKSTDGQFFTAIGEVKTPIQTANHIQAYQFLDNASTKKGAYYRIKSVGMDKSNTYSKVAFVAGSEADHTIQIYPNPAAASINVLHPTDAVYELVIINQLGQTVQYLSQHQNGQVIATEQLPNGIYYLRSTLNGQTTTAKFLKK